MRQTIRLVVFDFDGVFSNAQFQFGAGTLTKGLNGRDVWGLSMLRQAGFVTGLISHDNSVSLAHAPYLCDRLDKVHTPGSDGQRRPKLDILQAWIDELGFSLHEVAYMGDDLPDLPLLTQIGLAASPSDAVAEVKAACHIVTTAKGGDGAVREFCDFLLSQKATATHAGLLDCTLRDGGYINDWYFSEEFLRDYFPACVASGVSIVEVGFANKKAEGNVRAGRCRHLQDEDLRKFRNALGTNCKVAVMCDIAVANMDLLMPKHPDVDVVRLATSEDSLSEAKTLTNALLQEGYQVCLNFMSTHMYEPEALRRHAEDVPGAIIYIVDTLGCMHAQDILPYVRALRGFRVGLHLHNNLQQTPATFQRLKGMVELFDTTFGGLGRGAGNLPLELCDVSPEQASQISQLVARDFQGLQWGYHPDYVTTAILKCHPNYALELRRKHVPLEKAISILKSVQGRHRFDPRALNA